MTNIEFSKLLSNNSLQVSVESVDIQGLGIKDNTCLSLFIGPRNNNKGYFTEFNYSEKHPKRGWSFTFTNPERSSFVVELYKYNLFFKNELLGKTEIRVADIQTNSQSTRQILLRTPKDKPTARVTITLSIRTNDNSFMSYVQ